MGALSLAITGAAGFLGRATVAAALAHGHSVRALVRDASKAPQGAEPIECDLSEGVPHGALIGVDAVIHLAGAMSNDAEALARDTTKATEQLLNAIERDAGTARLVLASSISVYDAFAVPLGGVLSEDSPLETNLAKREAYTRSKLVQEAQAEATDLPLWTLRIGAVYGGLHVWNAHIGARAGSVLFSLARQGDVPLAHLQNVAEALVLAAELAPEAGHETLNVIDDDLPDRAAFIAQTHKGAHVPLSWRALMPLAYVAEALLGERAPGLLRPRVLAARMRPIRYDNSRLKARFGWSPLNRFGYGGEGLR